MSKQKKMSATNQVIGATANILLCMAVVVGTTGKYEQFTNFALFYLWFVGLLVFVAHCTGEESKKILRRQRQQQPVIFYVSKFTGLVEVVATACAGWFATATLCAVVLLMGLSSFKEETE